MLPVPSESLLVFMRERDGVLPAQRGTARLAQGEREQRAALIIESDKATVEGGVPEC